MPSTVDDLLRAANLTSAGVVRWGTSPSPPKSQNPATGIYIVALTDELDSVEGAIATPPISDEAVDELLGVRPELSIDGFRPTCQQLVDRLAAFWFPDEVLLYVGLAGPRKKQPTGGELAKRVKEYFDTPLGARTPHAGGWPLKTLGCLDELYVHYAYCDGVADAEDQCIARFAKNVSEETLASLRDSSRVMPFANLEYPKGSPKNHGIRGARAPRSQRGPSASATATGDQAVSTPPAKPSLQLESNDVHPAPGSNHRSQRVTPKDIETGQVRVPRDTKSILPPTRQDIAVELRGRRLTCRWDPRRGATERSGVIRVGRSAAHELLSPNEVLLVTVAEDRVVHLN